MTTYTIKNLKTGFERGGVTAEELIELAEEMAGNHGRCFFERTTALELLDNLYGYKNFNEISGEDKENCRWLAALAEKHGEKTILYRADYLAEEGEYSPTPIDELEAAIITIEHDSRYKIIKED